MRRNSEILRALRASALVSLKVKPLIYLAIPDRQMPKVLVPCPGGHGIAFVYPSIPCLGGGVFSDGTFSRQAEVGEPALAVRHEKEHEPCTGKAAVEGSKHEY